MSNDPHDGTKPPTEGPWPAGYGQPDPGPTCAGQPAPANGLGVAGFVTGLLGVLLFWIPFLGLVLAVCGVVLGATRMSQAKKAGQDTGLAVAGLVLGILGLLPALLVVVTAVSVAVF